jgi:hypothetical protein
MVSAVLVKAEWAMAIAQEQARRDGDAVVRHDGQYGQYDGGGWGNQNQQTNP